MTYYNDLSIPAYLFFEIAETNDLQKLVIKYKHSDKTLQNAWDKIYDAYYERIEDKQMERALESKKLISLLKMKIDLLENVLYMLSIMQAPKELIKPVIDSLKKVGIHIDQEKPTPVSVLKALQIDMVNLRTELDVETANYTKLTSGKSSTFTDEIVGVENVLERTIAEDVSLGKYISLKKSAKDKITRLKASKSKTKRR